MTYYRVDRRLFKVGCRIATASEYYGKFDDIAKEIENALEARRPMTKRRRPECLFLFEDEKCARKHWSKMTNGKLYEVSIDSAGVLHRGDMMQMDVMKMASESGQDISEVADAYWRGEHGQNPEIEIMVSGAVVTRVISTSDDERKDHLVKRWKGLV